MTTLLRIVKVGGSLFERPDLARRMQRWVTTQTPGWNVFIAGCGEMGNVVRKLDSRFHLGPERSHEMCIDLLGVTSQLLASILPESQVCDDWQTLAERQCPAIGTTPTVFAPVRFLRHDEAQLPGESLPRSWDVTTDSIAARLAEVTRADDLVLLKSSLPPSSADLDTLADRGYVDHYFPWAVKSLAEVRFVNLADDHFPARVAFE